LVDTPPNAPFAGSDEDAVETLERVLGEAVGCRWSQTFRWRFPVRGIDSSLVVALMQQRSHSTRAHLHDRLH